MNTTSATDSVPTLLDVPSLARRWNVKQDTIRDWTRRGVLPSIRIGKKILFSEADLVAFLAGARERAS